MSAITAYCIMNEDPLGTTLIVYKSLRQVKTNPVVTLIYHIVEYKSFFREVLNTFYSAVLVSSPFCVKERVCGTTHLKTFRAVSTCWERSDFRVCDSFPWHFAHTVVGIPEWCFRYYPALRSASLISKWTFQNINADALYIHEYDTWCQSKTLALISFFQNAIQAISLTFPYRFFGEKIVRLPQ